MADETFDEDIFDDLYDEPEEPAKPAPASAPIAAPPAVPADPESVAQSKPSVESGVPAPNYFDGQAVKDGYVPESGDAQMGGSNFAGGLDQGARNDPPVDDNYGPINVKEDG